MSDDDDALCGYCGGPHIEGRDHEEERRIWFGDHYSDDEIEPAGSSKVPLVELGGHVYALTEDGPDDIGSV